RRPSGAARPSPAIWRCASYPSSTYRRAGLRSPATPSTSIAPWWPWRAMDFLTALHVSGSGLSAERTRVNLASSNLANAETTRGANGKPYQRLDPVFQAIHMAAQDEAPTVGDAPMGVQVSQIVADQSPGKMVYSP